MAKTLTAGGKEFVVTGNPDMGTVKYVQEMEIEMMRSYLDDETILKLDQAEEDEIMSDILEDADIDDFKQMMWDRSVQEPLQTVSLATNERLTSEDMNGMKAQDWIELLETSEEALGGSASDFTDKLGIDISSTVRELEQQTEAPSSESYSQETPAAVSSLSRKQSKGEEGTEPTTNTR